MGLVWSEASSICVCVHQFLDKRTKFLWMIISGLVLHSLWEGTPGQSSLQLSNLEHCLVTIAEEYFTLS